ncbi:MAG: class II aldolase/adducin family protein [Gemmatimonadetes bacterium]|nr:class II aldolase/adducin family protein [Gemmatimonadota bacterium]
MCRPGSPAVGSLLRPPAAQRLAWPRRSLWSFHIAEVRRSPGRVREAREPAVRASSELAMHLAIYAERPDVGAIVHAHPPAATGFAVAGVAMPAGALAELAGVIGHVPIVAFEMPGTVALGRVVADALQTANVVLLANHGAVAVGTTLADATNLMESLEQAARILVTAHILGGVTELGHRDVIALERARIGGVRPRSAGRRTGDAGGPER